MQQTSLEGSYRVAEALKRRSSGSAHFMSIIAEIKRYSRPRVHAILMNNLLLLLSI